MGLGIRITGPLHTGRGQGGLLSGWDAPWRHSDVTGDVLSSLPLHTGSDINTSFCHSNARVSSVVCWHHFCVNGEWHQYWDFSELLPTLTAFPAEWWQAPPTGSGGSLGSIWDLPHKKSRYFFKVSYQGAQKDWYSELFRFQIFVWYLDPLVFFWRRRRGGGI